MHAEHESQDWVAHYLGSDRMMPHQGCTSAANKTGRAGDVDSKVVVVRLSGKTRTTGAAVGALRATTGIQLGQVRALGGT